MKRGDLVIVALSFGSQIARVLDGPGVDGWVPVRKWRKQGRCWTGRCLVHPENIRGSVDETDRRVQVMRKQGAFESEPK